MERPEIQEEFKQILELSIQRGNENLGMTLDEFMSELTSQLRLLLEKTNT
ncbi:hypothetical protein [Ureibacillus sp. GCM10028918]